MIENLKGGIVLKLQKKLIAVLVIIAIVIVGLTGCRPKGSKELFDAFRKSSEIKSYSSKAHVDLELDLDMDTTQFDENEQIIFDMYMGMIQDIEFDVEQKLVTKDEETYHSESDLSYNLGGLGFNIKMWQNINLSEDNFEMNQVIEIPQLFRPFFTEITGEISNKEYLVYNWSDFMEMSKEDDINFDIKKMLELSKDLGIELNETFLTTLDEFQKDYKGDNKIISYIGEEKIKGEMLDIYEMNFDDKSFKDFLRFAAKHILENEETEELIEEYLNVIGDLVFEMDPMGASKEEIESDIKEMLDELDLEEAKEKFIEFVDAFEDVELLGSDGIALTFSVNKDGFIVGNTGVIDLVFDTEEISEALSEAYPDEYNYNYSFDEDLPTIKMAVEFEVEISDINEELDIEFPELTEENSFNLIDMMEEIEQGNYY